MGFNIMDLQKGRSATVKSKADEGRAELKYIDVEDLVPSEDNFYSMNDIGELAAMIEISGGVKQPALVVPLGGGKYRVIAGHRRRLASLFLVKKGKEQYRKMPCMVEDAAPAPDTEAEELRAIDEAILLITTNGQREKTGWDRVQETERLRELLERKRKFEKIPGETRKIIAEQLGTTPAQVGRFDSIAKHLIQPFKEKLERGEINISVAYELSTLPKGEQYAARAECDTKGGLSIEDVKHRRADMAEKERMRAAAREGTTPEREPGDAPPAPVEREPEPVVTTCKGSGPVTVDMRPEPGQEPQKAFATGMNVEPMPAPERERMSNTRARMVLEDLSQYCEMEAEADGKWNEYVLALDVAIDALRGK